MELKKMHISDKKIQVLHQMHIQDTHDLLHYYPFRYEMIEQTPREAWEKDSKVVFEGIIVSMARVIRFKKNQSVTRFKVLFDDEEFSISVFNRPWVSNFQMGKTITCIGRYDGKQSITVSQYFFTPIQELLGFHPVYNLKEGITQKDLTKYIQKAFMLEKDSIQDWIPLTYRKKYQLISKQQALYGIHFPASKNVLKQSLRHLKYEEFLRFQLTMQAMKKLQQEMEKKTRKSFSFEDIERLEKSLSFELSIDQKKAIEEILQDLKSDKVMYRMVQGDVGCGKTLVAAFAMYACVLAHKQAALMVPTEILAKQHCKNLKELFADFEVEVEVLYSSLKPTKKEEVLQKLKNHTIDIVIGTHALFQESVEFYDLGLVVADEQHRFGVEQRKKLLNKGEMVDVLLMSATPIPRTLAISIYGDMDVSTIHTMPKNRLPIKTQYVASNSMSPILKFVLEKIDEGTQCYVVAPAIENNEDYAMRNVFDLYQGMKDTIGKKYRIGFMHGKLSSQEKEEVMNSFLAHELDILISTTVIEVGVDVANANIMVIYDAHRFGLSQIHQLRGRVGRGNQQGYCFLLSNTKEEESIKRLKMAASTSDGFEIAKYDLLLRGPGDLLGTRQSGVPDFILSNLVQDMNILEVARKDAFDILQNIHDPQYQMIKMDLDETIRQSTYLD